MDRVGFLIEKTGERLGCLLNPETLEITRRAGVRPRRSLGGALTGTGLSDDPLLYTGGGVTELKLDLLFDVSVAGSNIQSANVRDLTVPFWKLAENVAGEDGYGHAPTVRFVWGKIWNIPAIVTDIAERFEYFTPEGVPQRSWVRMRLLRVPEPEPTGAAPATSPDVALDLLEQAEDAEIPPDQLRTHTLIGGTTGSEEEGGEPAASERPDEIAYRTYGDPSLWRLLTGFNHIEDPLHIPAGTVLRIPPLSGLGNP
jgi:hypothetical protein